MDAAHFPHLRGGVLCVGQNLSRPREWPSRTIDLVRELKYNAGIALYVCPGSGGRASN